MDAYPVDNHHSKTTSKKIAVHKMSISYLIDCAHEDGIDVTREQAEQIRRASASGCLVWAGGHIRTTDSSRLDLH
jgi:hypothetical protein